ncbi:unnamed protein product, partial [Closterium sp. NIES-54]
MGVDVTRADRSLLFFESSRSRARLMNVLAVYAWFDPEVGYCQGMSDLMSPMVVLYPDDADAFWAFERLMRRVREDFMNTDTGLGIQREISRLSHMVYTLDPELHAHLDEIGAGLLHACSLSLTLVPLPTTPSHHPFPNRRDRSRHHVLHSPHSHGHEQAPCSSQSAQSWPCSAASSLLCMPSLSLSSPTPLPSLSDEIGAGTMFFTVRTVMAMFRRELSFADALYLWE